MLHEATRAIEAAGLKWKPEKLEVLPSSAAKDETPEIGLTICFNRDARASVEGASLAARYVPHYIFKKVESMINF